MKRTKIHGTCHSLITVISDRYECRYTQNAQMSKKKIFPGFGDLVNLTFRMTPFIIQMRYAHNVSAQNYFQYFI